MTNTYLKLAKIHLAYLNRTIKTDVETLNPTVGYLGCDAVFFKHYIALQMTPDMTFHNIILEYITSPLIVNEDTFLQCCYFSNIQPVKIEEGDGTP